jgi:hypothetical protein
MKIVLTELESESYFYSALCNGLSYISSYGLELDVDKEHYMAAKERLKVKAPNEVICYEDILMEVLRGGDKLMLIDTENEEEQPVLITIKDVHERVSKTPLRQLIDTIEENGDAETADIMLQTVFLNEVIYG